MSKTSDVLYGRRGGRFAKIARADTSLAEIHHDRLAAIRNGTWPHHADQDWHDAAAEATRCGDLTGAGVRAIETSKALRAAERRARGAA